MLSSFLIVSSFSILPVFRVDSGSKRTTLTSPVVFGLWGVPLGMIMNSPGFNNEEKFVLMLVLVAYEFASKLCNFYVLPV